MVASRANRTRRRVVASRRVARAPSALSSPSSRSIALSVRRASLRRSSHARVVAVVAIRASRPGAPAFARDRSIDRETIARSTARRSRDRSIDRAIDRRGRRIFVDRAARGAFSRKSDRDGDDPTRRSKRHRSATRPRLRASVRSFIARARFVANAGFGRRTTNDDGVDSSIDQSDWIDRFFAIGDLIRDGDACDAFGRRASVAGGDADAGSSRGRARAARGAVRGARGRRGGGREHETVEDDGGGVHGSRAQETSDAAGREVGGRDRV